MTEVTEIVDMEGRWFYAAESMTINWQDVIVTVFTTVGGGAVLLGASAYLIKTVITQRLTQEMETFKSELKASSDAEIEKLKSSLQMTVMEHQVRFSKLHEKRAEVIAELYKRLADTAYEVRSYVGHSPQWEELPRPIEEFRKVDLTLVALSRFIEEHRIYVPMRTCRLLDKFTSVLKQAIVVVGVYARIVPPSKQEWEKSRDELMDTFRTMDQQDIPEIQKQLDAEFRKLLGDS